MKLRRMRVREAALAAVVCLGLVHTGCQRVQAPHMASADAPPAKPTVQLNFHGLVGFALNKDSNEAVALVVNSLTEVGSSGPDYLVHTPYLELDCNTLTSPLPSDCLRKYPPSPDTGASLVPLAAGWEIEFPGLTGRKKLAVDATFKSGVVPLTTLATGGHANAAVLVEEPVLAWPATRALTPYLLARVRMNEGSLAGHGKSDHSPWEFPLDPGVYKQTTAHHVVFSVAQTARSFVLTLRPFNPNLTPLTFVFQIPDPANLLELAILNEPTAGEFCSTQPADNNVMPHFRRFYDLTLGAADAKTLPTPESKNDLMSCKDYFDKLNSNGAGGLKPVVCMNPLYATVDLP
jgi:hypothetical protein